MSRGADGSDAAERSRRVLGMVQGVIECGAELDGFGLGENEPLARADVEIVDPAQGQGVPAAVGMDAPAGAGYSGRRDCRPSNPTMLPPLFLSAVTPLPVRSMPCGVDDNAGPRRRRGCGFRIEAALGRSRIAATRPCTCRKKPSCPAGFSTAGSASGRAVGASKTQASVKRWERSRKDLARSARMSWKSCGRRGEIRVEKISAVLSSMFRLQV